MFLTLGFNPDDIIPVLRSMQNELIILGVALVLALVATIVVAKKPKATKKFARGTSWIAFLMVLISGVIFLLLSVVKIKGKTFREVSDFLSKELARIDSVTSTATQFIMRRYKEFGVELTSTEEDERGNFSL